MKKIITIIIVVICSLPLFSTTVIVAQNGNGDYTTIQAAVNGVSSGDTIWVAPGTYYESIEINTSLITLKSNDPELCIISSPNESHCIEINSGINKIEGFTIKNASNSALVTSSQLIELNNCIFENNESYAPNHGSAITAYSPFEELTECIFKNNSSPYTGSNFINDEELEYCSIYNSESIANATLTNCITVDPKISSTTYQPLWNSTTKSPCIDTGDPSITDPDETPSDMGAVRAIDHDYHITTATPNRYRYRSFPVLDRTYGEGFTTTYVCQSVEDQTEYFEIFNIDPSYTIWSQQNWNLTALGILNSKDGYKLYTDDEVDIPTSGITLPENTEVDLNAGENWVGYFVKESMTIDEAFADIWDHLEAVYSEDWAWQHGGVIQPERCALIYGKMYIVYVDAACSFVYGDGPSVPPEEREMTDGFTYSETPAYTPINITELDDPTVEEVGVLLDGECIGATKVEDFPLQILAFPPNTSRGSGNLTFAFYYGNRNYEYSEKYFIVDPNTGQTSQSTIELRPYHFNTISFGKPPKGSQTPKIITSNYPNPFYPSDTGRSPSTTIQFSTNNEQGKHVELAIYNIKGQKVKTLINSYMTINSGEIIWEGKDNAGKSVSSGVYLLIMKEDGQIAAKRKMMLIK